jgi:hypothetical protein
MAAIRVHKYSATQTILALWVACSGFAYGQIPESEQKAILGRTCESAMAYAESLQDFVCTQLTTRTADTSGTGKHWKLLETQELELSYVSHKENYRLVKVNGETTGMEKRVKKGYFIPGGEFGSSLLLIFNPKANATFDWDHVEMSHGRRICVSRYRIPAATSTMVIHADADNVRMTHHGLVDCDCDTGAITRIQIETEPASVRRHGRDISLGEKIDVRYGPVTIGSKEFFLPLLAESIGLFYKTQTKAEIRFEHYRKYESNSTITFGEGEIKHDDPAPRR